MKKQFKTSIFKSVLLLLSVALLLVSTVVVAVANVVATSTTHTLTVSFDAYVTKCTVTYEIDQAGNTKTQDIASGDTLTFFDGAYVSIKFEVKDGMWPTITYADTDNRASQAGTLIEWSSFVADNTVTVSCDDLVYTIHALNSNGDNKLVTGLPYDYLEVTGSQNTVDDLTSSQVKYQINTDDLVELPRVKKTNWIFKGWYIVTNATDATQGSGYFIEPVSEDGPCYMPKTLTMTDYMHAQNGVIYVYPYFVPECYDVYREDWIYKEAGDHRQTQLFSYKQQSVPVTSWYSALQQSYWGDDIEVGGYKSYAGYLLMTDCICVGACDENCIYAAKKVYNTESDATRNTVYRYYTPILYTLNFDLNGNDGETITFNNATTQYLYGNRAEIAVPSRTGYTFSGWKVQIYKNGQWIDALDLLAAQDGEDAGKYLLGTKYAKYEEATGKWNDLNAIYASEKNENGDYEIRLTAQWEPITINVEYNFGVDSALIINKEYFAQSENTGFKFNAGIVINNPVRQGWVFTGWTLTYADGTPVPAQDGLSKLNDTQYQIAASVHAKDIVLTANWSAETYTVVLDANGDGVPEFTITDVEYGSTSWVSQIPADLAAPTKEGYTFSGYWGNGQKYVYAVNGLLVAENIAWNIDGGANGATITLNAEWTINQYTVTLNSINGLNTTEGVVIKVIVGVEEIPFTSFPVSIELDYNTTFRVEITLPETLRLVLWNGEAIADYNGISFISGKLTVGAENMTLSAEARPAKPNIGAGYDVDVIIKSETEIQVDFANADVAQRYDIAISDSNDTSGLDWKHLAEGETQYVFENLKQGTKYYIFVRYSRTETTLEGIPSVKEKVTHFINFVKDTENSLKDLLTDADGDCVKGLVDKAIDDIYALIPENGELPYNFNQLVADIVANVEAKLAFARFQDSKIAELQAYRNACAASGSFRPENLSTVGNLCAQAVANISGASTENEVTDIFNTAMADMKAVSVTYLCDANNAITLESLLGLNHGSSIRLNTVQDIKALRRAIADAIAQGKITVDSFITLEEATNLLRALDTVAAYQFSVINVQIGEGDVFTLTLTIPEAFIGCTGLQVAYFNQATGMVELLETVREGNTLIFKAKYIADFVILADPTIDLTPVILALGAILFFQLLAIAFVLLARAKAKKSVLHASVALPAFLAVHFLPVANAELIVAGLGAAVLLAQIVLMWLLLSSGMIRFFKTKRTAPVAQQEVTAVVREEDLHEDPYTVFDEEEPAEEIVEETAEEVEEVLEEIVEEFVDEVVEELIEEPDQEFVEEEIIEDVDNEEFIEEANDEEIVEEFIEDTEEEVFEEKISEEDVLDEDAFDTELAEELAEELAAGEAEEYEEIVEEINDEEIIEDEIIDEEIIDEETIEEEIVDELPPEEVYEDEEFIEQESPETYYDVTDEEENEYAYNQEEAERASYAQETDQAYEDEAYDADPFEGVFGDSTESDGNSSNEAGDSPDEGGYGESYEYGDETNAPYAETEDADGEETSREGSIDQSAYIVNEEELSQEEEMYQYDE